ncbi:hypothetical protein [Pedobacter agri]|uniref:Uncharacterized protein n=1 Tax=Pedobacter agri TaxID=454586 RepID=A0A9X3DCV9_9SPHI|nr:hypothetical protein [Pedobacter agri]MCX3264856.1 hypothetical protein [Pedobacter agri]
MSSSKDLNPELQKFIDAFEPSKFKILKSGIEVRGITNIHNGIDYAKQIIQKLKLNLLIRHTADMTMYGGFEILEK